MPVLFSVSTHFWRVCFRGLGGLHSFEYIDNHICPCSVGIFLHTVLDFRENFRTNLAGISLLLTMNGNRSKNLLRLASLAAVDKQYGGLHALTPQQESGEKKPLFDGTSVKSVIRCSFTWFESGLFCILFVLFLSGRRRVKQYEVWYTYLGLFASSVHCFTAFITLS